MISWKAGLHLTTVECSLAIESLPSDLREELTTVRHLDHQAHNAMNSLNLRISAFFDSCKSSRLSEREKGIEYEQILKEFARAADYSKKKVAIVKNIYITYQKVMKKLDSELEKFRLELEADNSGVTSKIEHRIRTLLGRNMPGANRLEKRRAKFRSGHFFNTNRALPKRRTPFSLETPEKQFYVLKRRFAAFDTPMNLLPPSPYSGNGPSFMAEEASSFLMSENNSRFLTSDGLRHIPSTGSPNSIDHDMPDQDFGAFQADSQDFCDDDEDDLQLNFDPTKRSRTLGTPQRSTGISMDHHRIHHGGSSCYSPFVNTSDTEAVTLGAGGSAVVTDQSIDELLTNPTTSASPSLKCGESPRWVGGVAAATTIDKNRRVGVHSRRPSQMSSSTIDTNDETGGYVSSSEPHHLPHSHRYAQSPAGPLKDQQQQRQQQDSHASTTTAGAVVDESKYCFCKDVSYGDMIACDAPNCPIEWFHYPCVNLTVAPKGRWYCPICTANGAAGTRFAGMSSTSRKRMSRR
ncbi:Inhibitor of growth protein 3 [Echinococcus granulosus]|uniref:Inhibitor of growth protein n=1 Tax=Echinococcus granulosus TaxID=6210 RepID=W6UNL7_ECHGR|nr:Inhibitor of growth protein 3 [Echinococcus granulosus]EUB63250.1 Inhibitor of growth protein 3 [Echinococcus granulosus]